MSPSQKSSDLAREVYRLQEHAMGDRSKWDATGKRIMDIVKELHDLVCDLDYKSRIERLEERVDEMSSRLNFDAPA